jgi:GAF domain-containing protein
MNRISQFAKKTLQLTRIYPNVLDQQQARSLVQVALVTMGVMFVGALYQLFDGDPASDTLVVAGLPLFVGDVVYSFNYVLGFLTAWSAIFFCNRGMLGTGKALYLAGIGIFCFTLYALSGPYTHLLYMMALPVGAAGVMFGRRGLIVFTSLVVSAILLYGLMVASGTLAVVLSNPLRYSDVLVVTVSVTFLMVSIFSAFSGGQRVLIRRNLALATELTNLANVSRTIGSGARSEEVLYQMVELTRDQLGYYHVQIFLREMNTGMITLAAVAGKPEGGINRRVVPTEYNILNDIVLKQTTRLITMGSPQLERSEFLPETKNGLLIPMKYGDTILGILDVQSLQENAFTEQDIEALEGIAIQMAVALQTGRISDETVLLRREREDLTEQLKRSRNEAQKLRSEVDGRRWLSFLESRPDRVIGYDLRGQVISPIHVTPNSITFDEAAIRVDEATGVLYVPVFSKDQVIGTIELGKPQNGAWDSRRVEFARMVATRLAASMESLRLYEQAQTAVSREQMANQIGNTLQTKTDLDALIITATEAFRQALGATQTSIRLGAPEETSSSTNRDSNPRPIGAD